MENNGLDIGLREFKRMKALDRDVLVYENLLHIRKKLGAYHLNKKIQYVWLAVLTTIVLTLAGLRKFIPI